MNYTGADDVTERARFLPPRKIPESELKDLLAAHELWLQGKKSRKDRIDLRGLDLRGIDLSNAKLAHAFLTYSDLSQAVLSSADLSHAELVMVRFDEAILSGANLSNAFVVNASLINADFYGTKQSTRRTVIGPANLVKVKLTVSDLSGANLARADLSETDLSGCKLNRTCLTSANLSGATIQSATIKDSNFLLANLTQADFWGSTFDNVNFKSANMDNTNFKNSKGSFFVDDNPIRGTRFSTRAMDPYSLLRRTYTGPMFFLALVLTTIAFLPFVFKAMAWSFVGAVESRIDAYVGNTVAALETELPPNVVSHIRTTLDQLNPARSNQFVESRVWKIVIGWEEGNRYIAISITAILVIYNALRGWVTIQMSKLRDAEQRSQHSPARNEYERLFRVHSRFLNWFLYVALAVACFNGLLLLTATVYVPVN